MKARHATRATKETKGAVPRSLVGGKIEWVIPGAHWIGKKEVRPDLPVVWSECLNPDCPTELRDVE